MADIFHPMEYLTLQIRQIDLVIVDHGEGSHSRCREGEDHRRSQPTCTHDRDMRGSQPALGDVAEPGQDRVA
ncbi:hypothetical protein GCM10009796_14190 [Microbacterium koreense]